MRNAAYDTENMCVFLSVVVNHKRKQVQTSLNARYVKRFFCKQLIQHKYQFFVQRLQYHPRVRVDPRFFEFFIRKEYP